MRVLPKMLKLVIFFLLISLGSLDAKTRDISEIRNVAVNFMTMHKPNVNYEVDIVGTENMLYSGESSKNYVVVKLKPKGWVIVSKDDRVKPVIGFSYESNIDTQNVPIQYKEWMKGIDEQINFVLKQNLTDKSTLKEWGSLTKEPAVFKDELLYSNKSVLKASGSIKGPLLVNINWNQGSPWNNLTPTINGKHTWVGCVATAWAQIFDYYNWPTRGTGSHRYYWSRGNRYLSANFNTTYNWVNMSNYDKAKISRDIGIAVDMNYGLDGSGAWPHPERVKVYFKYNSGAFIWRSDYSNNIWHSKIKQDLDHNRPTYYVGYNKNNAGHAFVCDGYDYRTLTKYYHFNWGWGGSYNGWFTLEASSRETPFIKYQAGIFNISPKSTSFKKAHLLYPKSGIKLTNNAVLIKWKRNSARVKLRVYSYGLNKNIFLGYVAGNQIIIRNLPKDDSKLLIKLHSYDSNGVYKGSEQAIIRVP